MTINILIEMLLTLISVCPFVIIMTVSEKLVEKAMIGVPKSDRTPKHKSQDFLHE